MCGRFVVASEGTELVGVLRVDVVADDLPGPSFNIAPTALAAIVLDSTKSDPPVRRLESARWGLIPGWAKDPSIGARAFNARSETAAEKPMFRAALAARRAVVPMTGYYEWRRDGDAKVPMFIHPRDGAPLLTAGLFEWWKNPALAADDPRRWVLSFTILTRQAEGALADSHDRMPVFLDPDFADAWLEPDSDNAPDILAGAVDAAPLIADTLEAYRVGARVGNVRNNDPSLIVPE